MASAGADEGFVADPSVPSRAPVVSVRSPRYGATFGMVGPAPLPRDPFPPQFLEAGESVLASVKPTFRAYLGLPAVLFGAASLLALAGVGAVAPTSGTAALVLFLAFAAAFLANNALWSRLVGRGMLVILPLSFFLGGYASLLAPAPSSTGTGSATQAIVGYELPVFAVLELALPLALSIIVWFQSTYAVTDQRVIEVSGVFSRASRWIPMDQVGPLRVRQSVLGRWLGYGRIVFVDRFPKTGGHRRLLGLEFGPGVVGAVFYGIAEPRALADRLEEIIAPTRRIEPMPGVAPPEAVLPPYVAPRPVAAGTPVAPPTPAAAGDRCPRCGNALVYVAPAGRFYCATCGRYV